MEVKPKAVEPIAEPAVGPIERSTNNILMRTLARHDLAVIAGWVFRIFVIFLSLWLLSQGTKWISAFVFGFGFAAVGIGVYLTFRVLNFPDLTIEGSYALGAAVAANLIFNNPEGSFFGNPWVATFLAMIFGGVAGFATGILHTRFKINGLLASILVASGLYSINLHVLEPTAIINVGGKPNVVDSFIKPYQTIFNVERLDAAGREWLRLGFFAVVAVVLIFIFNWFLNTQLGLALRATGDNENMIRALGVNTDNAKVIILAVSNAMFGLAGAMISQYLQYADGQFGVGMIVIGLAAVILGESFVAPRSTLLALAGTLVGAIIYRLLFTGVFGLAVSWGLLLNIIIMLTLAAGLAGLTYLTLNSQTPGIITLVCIVLGGLIGAIGTLWLIVVVHGLFSDDPNRAILFEAENYDIRLVLSILIIVSMAVPAIRKRFGNRIIKLK